MTPAPPRLSRNVRRPKEAPPPPETPAAAPAPEGGVVAKAPSAVSRALGAVVGFVLIVGIGGAGVYGARSYVHKSPRFAVTEIVTSGGKRRSSEDLAAIAGLAKGQNVFSADLEKARTRLVADPWIKEASLGRQLPGTLVLRVVEREAAGILATGDGTYLVTREGEVIKTLEDGDPTDLPVVTGVTLAQVADDHEGAARVVRGALDLAADLERSPIGPRSPVEEVHVEKTGDLTAVIGKSGVRLAMGAAPYRRKIEQATRVLAELDRRGAKPGTIMLDNDGRPERVVVRMR